jgi:uncharacterized damage-inducible protein DinB
MSRKPDKPVSLIYFYNNVVLNRNLEGITHEESVRTAEGSPSTINWVLGHLLQNRLHIIRNILGKDVQTELNLDEIYKGGTKPDAAAAANLDALKSFFDTTQAIISEAIEDEDAIAKENQEKLNQLAFFSFHEAYHLGQLGILRKLLGKEGAI